jgi:hypothetical protein
LICGVERVGLNALAFGGGQTSAWRSTFSTFQGMNPAGALLMVGAGPSAAGDFSANYSTGLAPFPDSGVFRSP